MFLLPYSHVSECFGHALKVERTLTRYKHWFQYDNPDKYLHDTLVIAQFRNPYDWFKAMEQYVDPENYAMCDCGSVAPSPQLTLSLSLFYPLHPVFPTTVQHT
jgi:hypothetical protein